ncbi:MAG: DUF2877 domain-containing protein [Planctomycetota bacterium]|jgi:hypothetical protein|nr:DUF2877 domain-containing protein [Planctomycetota bacterium]
MTPRFAAATVGEFALTLLDGRRLTALAVFDGSFYLEDGAGGLLCALSNDREPGPLHLNCPDWPGNARRCVEKGDGFTVSGGVLLSKTVRMALTGAVVWRPRPLPACDPIAFPEAYRTLRAAAGRYVPPDTYLAACCYPEKAGRARHDSALLAGIRRGLAALRENPRTGAGMLIGLGPGLTPSGDDILAGALLTLRVLGFPGAADRLAGCVLPRLDHTNRISASHLRAAAAGRGAAVFHELLSSAFALEGVGECFARIGRIGHTSGWDTVLGMFAAIDNLVAGRDGKCPFFGPGRAASGNARLAGGREGGKTPSGGIGDRFHPAPPCPIPAV